MRKLLFIPWVTILLGTPGITFAQTTVTIPTTVALSNVARPGVVIGANDYYGSGQILKDYLYASFGSLPQVYFNARFYCNSGGTNDTTHWYNSASNANGYPANFWATATYQAISVTGANMGSGIITSSTANTSTGTQFVLGSALTAACHDGGNQSSEDILLVHLRGNNDSLMPPSSLENVSGSSSWSTDVSTASTTQNQAHSMQFTGTWTMPFDAVAANNMNTTGIGGTQVSYVNINGNYSLNFPAKCVSAGCTIAYSVGRIGTPNNITGGTGTVSPSTSAWTSYSKPFTGSETGTQTSTGQVQLTCTGTCLIGDTHMVEGSTLSGNTTPFRDAYVRQLQLLNPGSGRVMSSNEWPTDATDSIVFPQGTERAAGGSAYLHPGPGNVTVGAPISNDSSLQLLYFLNADVVLSLGTFQTTADMTTYVNTLLNSTAGCSICTGAQTWNSLFAAKGLHIVTSLGNEAWNTVAFNDIAGGSPNGGGTEYGALVGPLTAALRGAAGWNSAVDKISWDGWASLSQTGAYGWLYNVTAGAGCTSVSSTPTRCPDYVEYGPYKLDTLSSLTDPVGDEFAENTNTDSIPTSNSAGNGQQNMYSAAAYAKTTYGIGTMVYENGYGLSSGSATPTQAQMNGISNSVGSGLTAAEDVELLRRDAALTGPLNYFAMHDFQDYTSINGTYQTAWSGLRYAAAGPGQLSSWTDAPGAVLVALGALNNAIGSNTSLLATTQSGTPTYSYAAGQGGTILANSSMPYVNCFAHTNSAQSNVTVACWNRNETTSEPVTFAGALAPTSSTSGALTVFGGTAHALTDNNANSWIGNNASGLTVAAPTAGTFTGNTATLQPKSMSLFTYSPGGSTPVATAPTFSLAAGTYPSVTSETTTISNATSYCYTAQSSCTPGTLYTAGTSIYIGASETLCALNAPAGYTPSSTVCSAYGIGTNSGIPAYSMAGGTYPTGTYTVNISNTNNQAVSFCTTDGTTPDYTSPQVSSVTVSSTTTLKCIGGIIGLQTNNTQLLTPNSTTTIPPPAPVAPSSYPGWKSVCSNTTCAPGGTLPPVAPTSQTFVTTPCQAGSAKCTEFQQTTGSSTGQTNSLWTEVGPNTSATSCDNCTYQVSKFAVYPNANVSNASALEFDQFNFRKSLTAQSSTGLNTMYGMQCLKGSTNKWQTLARSGSWVTTPLSCSGLTASNWHTIAVQNHIVLSDTSCTTTGVSAGIPTQYYDLIVVDGVKTNWNLTNCSYPLQSGYTSTIGHQFQIDSATKSATASEEIDNASVTALYDPSAVQTATYTINAVQPMASTPTFTPAAGTYTTPQSVTIATTTTGAAIYYTTDGSTPITSSAVYSAPITVSAVNETLSAIAVLSGDTNSAVGTATYAIQTPTVAEPVVTPAGGMFTTPTTVTMTDATSGATIYYTTDGSQPTSSSTVYSGPITVSTSETINAIGILNGAYNSPVNTVSFVIQAGSVTFAPAGNTYSAVTNVSLACPTPSSSIFYTLDGSTPTTSSTPYTGTISVGMTETVTAICTANGYSSSAPTSAAYVINLTPPPATGTPSTTANPGITLNGVTLN